MRISKTFEVDAAHVLDLPYASKCRNLHGHTYRITVEVDDKVDVHGMVLDYTKFPKDLVMEWMDHKLLASQMHCTIVRIEEEEAIGVDVGSVHCTLPASSVCVLDGTKNSTGEEIARWLYLSLRATGFNVHRIEVSETEATKASYP